MDKPRRTNVTVWIDPKVKAKYEAQAIEQGRQLGEILRMVLEGTEAKSTSETIEAALKAHVEEYHVPRDLLPKVQQDPDTMKWNLHPAHHAGEIPLAHVSGELKPNGSKHTETSAKSAPNRKPHTPRSEAEKKKALKLVDSGLSYRKIEKETGVPRATISQWVKEREQETGAGA